MRTAKAWVAAVGSIVTALGAALSDDAFSASDTQQVILTVALAVGTLVSVYAVPNRPAPVING
jgi:hypothetical protein